MRRLAKLAVAGWLVYGLVTLGKAYGRVCNRVCAAAEDQYDYSTPPRYPARSRW